MVFPSRKLEELLLFHIVLSFVYDHTYMVLIGPARPIVGIEQYKCEVINESNLILVFFTLSQPRLQLTNERLFLFMKFFFHLVVILCD